MKNMRSLPRIVATVALMLGACVIGRGQADTSTRNNAGNDAAFIAKSIKDNQMEIEMSQLAIEKSNNSKIKSLAQQMVKDHTLMLEDLRKLQGNAGSGNAATGNDNENDNAAAMDTGALNKPGDTGTASNQVDMQAKRTSKSDTTDPGMQSDTGMADTDMQADTSSHHSMLMNATGKEFDDMWVSHMLDAHTAKLDELTAAQGSLKNSQLKASVQKAIPKVRMHKQTLQQMSKGSSKTTSK